jgi:SAM-dependent methyltransferase/mannose-6-phosphate isomerase-like protein (cupin superfamily)
MKYIHVLPSFPSFEGKGLFGFTYGPLQQKDMEIYYIHVEKGHDTFMVSKRIVRIYYVVSGYGYFTIDNQKYDVHPGMLVEVSPKLEFSYSGEMTLLGISRPRWFAGNDTHTKWNTDVFQGAFARVEEHESRLAHLARTKIFGKSPASAYLRIHRRLWRNLPALVSDFGPVRSYGNLVHGLARVYGFRGQTIGAYFLQNRPQLELIRRLAVQSAKAGALTIAVLGCAAGAEAYSIAWVVRSANPELKLSIHVIDSSRFALEIAELGAYSKDADSIGRVTEREIDELFDRDGDTVKVKSWIKEGIQWRVGDIGETEILDTLGSYDIVVASNFLGHMYPRKAEKCLRNIARLARPDGYLIISGVDLDIRTKVATDLKWRPVNQLLEDVHEGDSSVRALWPWHYSGLEPFDKKRQDWGRRYATAFHVVPQDNA